MPGFWSSIYKELSVADRKLVARCPLWIAHWEVRDPGALAPWNDDWMLWQDSDHGRVGGVRGKCDTDCFRGAPEDIVVIRRDQLTCRCLLGGRHGADGEDTVDGRGI